MSFSAALFIWLGIAIILAFILPFVFMARKARWMERRGERIIAKVASVQHDKKRTSMGVMHHFYTVSAVWTNPATGQTYTFWKYFFDEDPDKPIGDMVSVIIDPSNPKHYEIQI